MPQIFVEFCGFDFQSSPRISFAAFLNKDVLFFVEKMRTLLIIYLSIPVRLKIVFIISLLTGWMGLNL